ncbi:beta-galactosidase [Streptomyces sp. J2-1]|uniref:glycoside hydrolase family 35 protein n=1 Tax=Streptomyces corallincola TaxID=2851888 RepID=UPI001C384C5D|nr:beta-galactosidase [Streptomyces corallincola]MBV2353809.1 beta-galactosidase [Streptomyces corallincola]
MALTRRTFSALAGSAALGLALGGSAGPGAFSAFAAHVVPTGPAPAPPRRDGKRHTIGYDRNSLIVDGRRMVVWSGEMHPFRLPSPSLWRDVLQKMRAHGYNTVSIYVAWNYHSPAPGQYDFSGIRDLDLFLRMATETGIYVILRPGPYINAEVDGGGFPGWLTATKGTARSSDPTYLSHVDEWLTQVNRIVRRHLFTQGLGTVLLYQIENEYDSFVREARGRDYMSHLYKKVRADGIDVPLFHNDKGRNGYWTPGSFDMGGEEGGWLYGFDGYPSPSQVPPDWGTFGKGGATGGTTASPDTPGFVPEFGGGWFDPWGGSWFDGEGYAGSRRTRDAAYERRFYLTNLANGITLHNVYMTFGGTSWGWLPAPVVYTSYDYGAAIDEGRNVDPAKMAAMHQIGHLLQRVPDFARLDRAADVQVKGLKVYHLVNPDTGAHVYVARNDGSEPVTAEVPTEGGKLRVTVPARDARLLTSHLAVGRRTLKSATAAPMLRLATGRLEIAAFAGRSGDMAELVLNCPVEPNVWRLDPEAAWAYDRNEARISAPLGQGGLSRVLVQGGETDMPLLLLLADDATSLRLFPFDTPTGSVLVYGPKLVRHAEVRGSEVRLTGDLTDASEIEVWAPRGVTALVWNGQRQQTRITTSGSVMTTGQVPGAPEVALPALGGWRTRTENPEAGPGFDDSGWRRADRTTTYSTTAVPEGRPVLFADDYGFHYGDVWYRGSFADASGLTEVTLPYSTGTQGLLMAWLDGEPLGTHRMPVPDKDVTIRKGSWDASPAFGVPERLRTPGRHVLSVLVRRMQHDQDGKALDTHKVARGLTDVRFAGAAGGGPSVAWRIQGAAGADPERGPMNTGGLFGERSGWHLPDFRDGDWERVSFPRSDRRQGVTWYRTGFRLSIPSDIDASVGLRLTDDPYRAYRVQIFLNGWNMGQYINNVGPQHTFVLPNGVLRTRGENTLALAVLSEFTSESGPGDVQLVLLGRALGGVGAVPGGTR